MQVSCWIKVKAVRSNYTSDIENPDYFLSRELKVYKEKPDTGSSEIAVKLDLEIPNALFVKPTVSFKASIPESVATIPVIEAEVQDRLVDMLEAELGQRVHLSISHDEE